MVAHNERSVSPTPEHGTERAIDAAAFQLAREVKAYAQAHPEYEIPVGQRFLVAQTLAMDVLIPLLAAAHHQLDDVFPDGKTRLERKRDVLMSLLTTYMLPEVLESTADAAAITGHGDRNAIHEAVYGTTDVLFDFTVQRADRAVREASRTE